MSRLNFKKTVELLKGNSKVLKFVATMIVIILVYYIYILNVPTASVTIEDKTYELKAKD